MSNGVQGKLVTSSMPWFKLRYKNKKIDDEQGAKEWLEDAENGLYSIFNACSFYDSMSEVFPDGIALGTAYLFIENTPQGIVFSPRHHKEMYISENRFGKVDTFFRKFSMTNRQALETFGELYPEDLSTNAEENPEGLVCLIHAVKPRPNGKAGPDIPAELKRFGSYYLAYSIGSQASPKASGQMIRESGYDNFPLVAWRFKKNPGEVYGRGPGMDAIYDVQMVNQAAKSLQEASHRALRPPLVAHEDFRGHIRTNPGGITYWSGQGDPRIQALNTLGSFPLTLEAINEQRNIIREHFHADFFTILSMQRDRLQQGAAQGKTATEIAAITAETSSVMGSVVSRNQSELLVPILILSFALGREIGIIPEPPNNLIDKYGDAELEPEFIGPLALAQKQYLSYQGTFEAGAAVCQLAGLAQMPDLLLNFDWNGIIRDAGEAKGIASKNILPPTQVEQLKKEVSQARAAQAQMQLQLQQSQIAGGPNKAPEPGSPAARMTNG
jgi:hypothetical protein